MDKIQVVNPVTCFSSIFIHLFICYTPSENYKIAMIRLRLAPVDGHEVSKPDR